MISKLGLNKYKLEEVEKKIINYKLNLLDEEFTFNKDKFDLNYLISLQEFLFSDFYIKEEIGIRELKTEEIRLIEMNLEKIIYICINNKDNIEGIIENIQEIWHLQPFLVGNTRTLVAFMKILSKAFDLNYYININGKIENNPDIFKLENEVNQNGLTKKK